METAKRAVEIAAGRWPQPAPDRPTRRRQIHARRPFARPVTGPRPKIRAGGQHGAQRRRAARRWSAGHASAVREPHHSASQAAIAGGGHRARPGEVSLAHRGVLFLDELPEFPRQALESLRQPMESGCTTVARASAHVTYPARFQLVAAMNPCRCGYFGDAERECGRVPRCGEDYQNRVSGPVLDRIDLTVAVQPATAAELAHAPCGEPSAVIAQRVAKARQSQATRHAADGTLCNAEADPKLGHELIKVFTRRGVG